MWKVIDQFIFDCPSTISIWLHFVILYYILSFIISTKKLIIIILELFCYIILLYNTHINYYKLDIFEYVNK